MKRRALAVGIMMASLCTGAYAQDAMWPYQVSIEQPPRRGKPQKPKQVKMWLPKDVKYVRGLLCTGTVVIDHKLPKDGQIRKVCQEMHMGIVAPGMGMPGTQKVFDQLAEKSGHPEVAYAPVLTTGHSAAGIWCRNVAYMNPDRVLGVVMIKSGNFQDGIPDIGKSLAGVPLLCVNGEFEQFGPAGGDLGAGHRAKYSLHPTNKKKQNQTQWVMVRMQIMDRRRKNPRNMMSLIVDRGGHHTSWNSELTKLTCDFIRSAAGARLPDGEPDPSKPRKCKTLKLEDGWLSDPDIKAPKHKPAPYSDYTGDKTLSFWYPDEAFAKAVCAYHDKGWDQPDPTAKEPLEERYYPPAILQDMIDAPPPAVLTWKGGEGTWDKESKSWLDGEQDTVWTGKRQAFIDKPGSKVTLAGNMGSFGLKLGKGCVLDMGESSLKAKWHGTIEDGAEVRVKLQERERPSRRGARLFFEGALKVGGKLVIEAHESLGGTYPIVGSKGELEGKFSEIVVPDGWSVVAKANRVSIERPKPAKGRKR